MVPWIIDNIDKNMFYATEWCLNVVHLTRSLTSPEARQTDGQSKLSYAVELDTGHISSGSIILCEGSDCRKSRMRGHLVGYYVGHFVEYGPLCGINLVRLSGVWAARDISWFHYVTFGYIPPQYNNGSLQLSDLLSWRVPMTVRMLSPGQGIETSQTR